MIARVLAVLLAASSLSGCLILEDKTLGESFDDTTTSTEIKTRLFGAGGFSHFGEVDVQVVDRFVLLSGRVPSEADKVEAERITWGVKSVDEVANELVITSGDFGRGVNDNWIIGQIKTGLIANSKVTGVNYIVRAFDGVVYLLGVARSEDELRDAAETAAKVKGVKKVVSYVKIRQKGQPSADLQAADASQPAAAAPASSAPINIAPSADAAPIVPPDKPPTTRAQYGDPYAPGAAPPPGAKNNSGGLQSAPLPPARSQ
ncbi:MAG TPA: BON domain-containing protein [Hyphomonadaceae bacterium]|nr:BON domain-containing protein [Hyphomonadaceae bacterium]